MYNINRRKFLGLFSCGCCSLLLPSCATVPITERKQLRLLPESTINKQAAQIYANFKSKAKLSKDKKQLDEIIEIGSKIAQTKSDNPDITYMETVDAYFYLKDGRVVTVRSLFATYNRETNDIFFKDEVIIDDGESQLYSDNLDIITSSNFVKVYNSVRFSENANWMVADKIEIDLSKKISTISMYTDEQVKIKLKK